ncbi:MAG: hypothetical protein M5R40_19450 [Anaerolineae bacterium]|nr:hypothetical protein [Anaerolineae bacterium]
MDAPHLQQLQAALARLEPRLRAAAARAQAAGHDPTDALRGLVITGAEVEALLARAPLAGLWPSGEAAPDAPQATSEGDPPLPALARAFGLTALDCDILLVALAPELDRRYERLYAYLQDDVSQRRPTVNLAMNLLSNDLADAAARFAIWERLTATAPLRAHHLIDCIPDRNQREPAFLAHFVKIDHRIVAHLLGDATPDTRLEGRGRAAGRRQGVDHGHRRDRRPPPAGHRRRRDGASPGAGGRGPA